MSSYSPEDGEHRSFKESSAEDNEEDYNEMIEEDEEGQDADMELVDECDDEQLPINDDSFATINAHTKDVFCLAISPNKRWLASGSEDETMAIWELQSDVNSSKLNARINSHLDTVHLLAWNSSGNFLASADMAGRILCTPLSATNSPLIIDHCESSQLNGNEQTGGSEDGASVESLYWLLWHPVADGILFSGCRDGSIWMWLITWQNESHLGVHQSKIFSTNSSAPCSAGYLLPDAKHLLAGYENSIARVWNLKEAISEEIPLPGACSGPIDVNSNAKLAALGCQNGLTALISTAQKPKLLNAFQSIERKQASAGCEQPANNSVETVRFAPGGLSWLAVGTADGHLSIFDWEKLSARYECEHDGEAVVSCIWHCGPGSVSIISACIDGGIRIWDAKSGEPLTLMAGAGHEIYFLTLLEEDNGRTLLFSACANGLIRVFRIPAGEENINVDGT